MAERKKKAEKATEETTTQVESTNEVKPEVESKPLEVKPSVTSSSKMNYKKFAPVAAIIAVIILVLGAVLIFGGSDDEGIEIPDDFEKYESDGVSFGYPESNWDVSDSFGTISVAKSVSDDEDLDLDNIEESLSSSTVSISKSAEADRDLISSVNGGSCDEIEDDVKDGFEDQDFQGGDVDIKKVDKIKIHGKNTCKFEIETSTFGFKTTVINYFLAVNDEEGYSLTILRYGDKNDDFDNAEKVVKTFKVED